MTGHKGERRNRRVALQTDDFRLYHRLAPYFEAHGLPIVGLKAGEAAPRSVQVILGGPTDDRRSVPIHDDAEATLLACYAHLDGGYRRITFGVDPGRKIGLAVMGDGQPLLVAEATSPPAAAQRLAAWRDALPGPAASIHVGDGSPASGRAIVAELKRALPTMKVHVVPEHATTPYSPVTGSRHTDAAVSIALRGPA